MTTRTTKPAITIDTTTVKKNTDDLRTMRVDLSMATIDGNNQRRRWQLSFRYNDDNYDVRICHNYASDEIEYQVFVTNYDKFDEELRYETKAQRLGRLEHAIPHMQSDPFYEGKSDEELEVLATEGYFMWANNEHAIVARILECLRRWEMLQMIVTPGINLS